MRRDPRIRLKRWLYWSAFFIALVAAQPVYNACVPLGGAGRIWVAHGTIRLELATPSAGLDGWRGHPWEVRYKRRNPGTVVEIGSALIFITAGALGVAAFFIRPRRIPPTLCWSCWHDLSGLPPDVRKCPECGELQEDEPV